MRYKGLSSEEAKKKLQEFGENKIKREKRVSPVKMFISQFTSPIILLLISAAVISLSINYFKHTDYFDSILILTIVFAAAVAGFVQDYKAEKAVEALQKLATPNARVIRDGKEQEIKATEIVPDDIIVLKGGDVIPADARIIDGNLEIDESILTGESKSVKKFKEDKIFSGCPVYIGKAYAKVFATGMATEIGKIASKMQEIEETNTPFQMHMRKFTKKIVILTSLVIVVTFIVGLQKFGIFESFLIAISLAVAAIPEDLPAVTTIALSLGARQMVRRNALVRRLAITESIGSVDVICTDKTGTITEGKMKVHNVWFLKDHKKAQDLALKICYYCNDSERALNKKVEKWIGDETDIALKQFAMNSVVLGGKRVMEIPFSSKRKMMTVVTEIEGKKIVFSKGAPEVIVSKSNRAFKNGKELPITENLKQKILRKNEELASKGYRVLALAYKENKKPLEKNLVFVGLAVLSDPARPEVKEAVKECHTAGIRIIMITGDNPKTAKAIADEVGIRTKAGVVVGSEIDKMNEVKLREILRRGVNVFARTNPFHKLRILEALQKEDHIVAMTGDGVNDSLALKKADVGISMGIKGTEVAKEASDIILLDDNFATIRNAIKEGRRIFDNIRKFVDYLLTCNVAEVAVVLLATIFFPFILLYPVQILWINLITDGLPALALSIDPPRPDVMKRKPRKREEGIINKKLAMLIGGIGTKKSLVILATFFAALPFGLSVARTVLFTGFIMYEFVRIGVIRYNEKLSSLRDWLANKFLVYSLAASLALQLILIYSPLSKEFKVVPIGLYPWVILIVGTTGGFALGIAIAYAIDKITKEEY